MDVVIAIAAVVVIIGVVPVVSYNRFVAQRQAVASAWATVGAELDRRHRLIPELVTLVRVETERERQIFTRLAQAAEAQRHPDDVAASAQIDTAVRAAAAAVFATGERTPSLASQPSYRALLEALTMSEDRLAAARRVYNSRVTDFNRRIDAVPSSLVAKRMGLSPAPWFGSAGKD